MSESRKHAPRLDEALERQAEGHLQGGPAGGRAEEWRETENPAEGEPDVTFTPEPDAEGMTDVELVFTPDEIEARSRFGRYVAGPGFPATRDDMIHNAHEAGAPDDVIEDLQRLPAGERYETPARAWAALGRGMDERF